MHVKFAKKKSFVWNFKNLKIDFFSIVSDMAVRKNKLKKLFFETF